VQAAATFREHVKPLSTGFRMKSVLGWLIPSMGDLLFMGCLAVILIVASRLVSMDGDASRHIAVGEQMLASGRILHEDLFSHTRGGDAFVPYEWLAEVSSAASYRLAGLAGPVLLHGSVIGASFALLYWHLRRRGHPLLLALAVAVLAASASALHWLMRPHVFTFLGTAVFAAVLDLWLLRRLSARWLWALPVTMVLWVNTHGGFLIGLILVGAYVGADVLRILGGARDVAQEAVRRQRALALPAAAILAATLVNPAGLGLYGHVTGYFKKKLLVDMTHEYMSPNFHEADFMAFLVMLIGTALCLSWSRRRPALHEGLLLAGFTYFALHSARNVPLFAIVVSPLLGSLLGGLQMPPVSDRLRGAADRAAGWIAKRNAAYSRVEAKSEGPAWALLSVTVLLGVAIAQVRAGDAPLNVRFDRTRQPVEAVEYLKQNPPAGNMINELVWGGYLIHELWPTHEVFIDGQTDFYGEELTREWLQAVMLEKSWRDVLAKHDVRWAIYMTDSPFARALAAEPGWRVAHQDTLATVLVKYQDTPGSAG
jgi:hypothetical protein